MRDGAWTQRLLTLVLCTAPLAARSQTMLDQEQRLIELHSLLLLLTPAGPPGAYEPGQLSLGLEAIGIPSIDGTTGGKRQITASDRTPVFPRPRLALGLPAPEGYRAFAGLAFIPPLAIRDVSSSLGGLEAGIARVEGPLAAGVRAHFVAARSKSPVTDPATRDRLDTVALGADVSAGYRFDAGAAEVLPFAALGLSRVNGTFLVTSDDSVLSSSTWNPSLTAGLRLFARAGVEGMAELTVFPGRMVHPAFALAWTPGWRAFR